MKFLSVFVFTAFTISLYLPNIAYAQDDFYNAAQNAGDNAVNKSSSEILRDFFNIFSGGDLNVIDQVPINTSNGSISESPSNDGQNEDIYGPLPLNSQVASTAQKIATVVKSSCTQFPVPPQFRNLIGGIVRSSNASCVDPVSSVLGQPVGGQVVAELKTSATLYKNLQCVGCVVAFAKTTKPYSVWGNAKNYIGKQIPGYKYIPGNKTAKDKSYFKVIRPGAFFILDKWTYGHIGIVTDIILDANGVPHSFRAFECNYGAPGLLRHDLTWSFLEVDGFQVPL